MAFSRSICVYCGARPGSGHDFLAVGRAVGQAIASRRWNLIYGGGGGGVMGAVADGVLEAGGHVIGVIPQAMMPLEVAHTSLPDLRIVATMHERKALMAELADGFLALPGGLGTLEELAEALTWSQLGYLTKPVVILNAHGFYDPLLVWLDHATEHGFISVAQRAAIRVERDVAAALDVIVTAE